MVQPLNISIRPLTSADEPFLWEMLYQALYVGEGNKPFSRDVLKRPEISRYAQDWGQGHDLGFLAVEDIEGQPIAAIWLRLLSGDNKGYGYVDDATPELSIAVLPEHRGRGIGTKLLVHLLHEARSRYPAISLSVSRDNPAVRLYERLGFKTLSTTGNSVTMIKGLSAKQKMRAI